VTETKWVDVQCGEWKTVTETIPGPIVEKCVRTPGTWEVDHNSCCPVYKPGCCKTVKVQCPCKKICRKVWCPKTVRKQVCCTRYVNEVRRCKVPYTVCCQVPCTTTKRVPYTTCRMVQSCRVVRVPVTKCTYVRQCITKKVPYTTCHWVEQCHTKRIPYTTCTMVRQCVTKRIPYTTCTMVRQTCTRKVPYTVCKRVCCTKMVITKRCVPRCVTCRGVRCVPRVVCRKVPVCGCCNPSACAAPDTCAAPMDCAPGHTEPTPLEPKPMNDVQEDYET